MGSKFEIVFSDPQKDVIRRIDHKNRCRGLAVEEMKPSKITIAELFFTGRGAKIPDHIVMKFCLSVGSPTSSLTPIIITVGRWDLRIAGVDVSPCIDFCCRP